MSVAKYLHCRYCRSMELKAVRGRYGKPVSFKHGVLRLIQCTSCGKHNLVATLTVTKRNAEDITDIMGAS